ncbi:GNAT family N-acetyltransferase [Rhodopirellula bahusiensis]|uniref:GNAT family N-acetyltransferase n=1 Tax=Rhodopirellula bahusiensis TaxID=2014065 RepID=A0A2G1W3H5_9BACT|nr:GNAT family N-acetyltransferase [Rhodopirellula bahusiensis]PHQ33573.1 GNAT family N-acetyltransferase [Rhodopirellula bahusiensis]
MEFLEIEWCTPLYQEALDLRHRVLREPLGLRLTAEELDGEYADLHFGLRNGTENLAAVLSAKLLTSSAVKLRQMAVDPDQQGEGLGAKLLVEVETALEQRGYTQFQLHARETAIGFYEKAGYTAVGETFTEISLPHRKMVKPHDDA